MNRSRSLAAVALAAAAATVLSSCAVNEMEVGDTGSTLDGYLVGAGSSAQGAAQQSWIAAFQTDHPGVTVDYDPAGSGAGRDTFIEGAGDFAGSDRAYTTDELEDGDFGRCAPDSAVVELPLYISPIAVVFSLDGIDSLNLDAATIAGIFAGDITDWDDPAIAATNPGVTLPDLAITAVHRSDDSGTTENFTDYLHAAAPDAWEWEADGVWPFSGGEAAQGNSGVVDTVGSGVGTIGYADASRAGSLGTAAVRVGDEFVSFSPEAAAAVVDASPLEAGRAEGDLAISIDRTTEQAGVYPIVLVSYLIACEQYASSRNAEIVREYLAYIASEEGQQAAAAGAGSAPISDAMRERAMQAIESISG
ncbi:phosphate-binding protein PstS [Agromyces luteolus]|uniref:Phosphate-binding protein n=1 Tax=Agromyces luteolus TaxID=88373 RepID=A0A7C9MHF3_9MICO|nr:phosphate ABC transporter substrate-binding protein PstS [Agromyces luteolus]MUN07158.1 extracellular solute-binding protein [Agromyces luteolus]GLK29410.1 phosphate-binding protein PstS [Agromyces luteolus]